MTYYAGFDVSMKSTSIAIVNDKGKICFERVCKTDRKFLLKQLQILVLYARKSVLNRVASPFGSLMS